MNQLKETTTPLILKSPVDHLPLYTQIWESELSSRMQYWRNEYQTNMNGAQRPCEIMIPMKITINSGHKAKTGWLVAQIKIEQKEISFWIPRRDMREETSYF